MSEAVLLDTGPLVALLSTRDHAHAFAKEAFAAVEPPLLTCEAVIAEACFLLRRFPGGEDAVLGLCEDGVLDASFRFADHAARVRKLMATYADVPMSFADACLVRLAELHPRCRVLTLDDDFRVYRRNGRQVVPTWMPGG